MSDVNYPDFIGEADRLEFDQAMAHIAKAIIGTRADFLFGAGMSVPSEVPAGNKLAGKLLSLFFPNADGDSIMEARLLELANTVDFECIAQAIEDSPGKKREGLTEFLTEILLKPDFGINQAHRNFLSVCCWDGHPRLKRVFTTNFDLLLEKALDAQGVRVTKKNAREIEDIQFRRQIPILHLHGTLDEEYEVTESDVFKGGFRALNSVLQRALGEADAFVFVGYSMSDPDFRSLYLEHRKEIALRRENQSNHLKEAYVVSPAKDKYAYVLGKGVWKSRCVIWLPLEAEHFFAEIKNILEKKASKEMQSAIMKKYGLGNREAYQDKIKNTAEILRIDEAEAVQFLFEVRPKTGTKV